MRIRRAAALVAAATVLAFGCADDTSEPGEPEAPPPTEGPGTPDEDADDTVDPGLAFDHEEAVDEARELLGTPEDEIVEDDQTRIVRRGDERLPVTMDLRPGRRNLELDDDGTGTYVVTRVVIEVAEGDDLVVE